MLADRPFQAPASDPLGHALLRERLEQAPDLLAGLLTAPRLPAKLNVTGRIVATGAGAAGEAHARFLVYLVNEYTEGAAEYRPLSAFGRAPDRAATGRTLAVFAPWLAPNARLALDRVGQFARTYFFSAATPESLARAGLPETARYLERQLAAGVALCGYPPEEQENHLLLRQLGPLAGYLACLQFVEAAWPGAVPPCAKDTLLAALRAAPIRASSLALEPFRHGCALLAADPFPRFGQNLAAKFMEGLFLPPAPVWDYLAFAHGPFQALVAGKPLPVLVLHGPTPLETTLLERARPLLQMGGSYTWVVKSDLPLPWRIFEYEMTLNALVLRAAAAWGIDQRRWPGRDRAGSLYYVDQLPDENGA